MKDMIECMYGTNISTRMHRDEYVSLDSIEKICQVLNCKIDDIVEFLPEPNQSVHDNELKE